MRVVATIGRDKLCRICPIGASTGPYFISSSRQTCILKQECIPLGCVPPAAVAMGGGVCLSACSDTHTPGCGPGAAHTPPRPDPSTSPLDVGLEAPLARPLNFPPGCAPRNLQSMLRYHTLPRDLLQGQLGYYLQCMLGYHPHPEQND